MEKSTENFGCHCDICFIYKIKYTAREQWPRPTLRQSPEHKLYSSQSFQQILLRTLNCLALCLCLPVSFSSSFGKVAFSFICMLLLPSLTNSVAHTRAIFLLNPETWVSCRPLRDIREAAGTIVKELVSTNHPVSLISGRNIEPSDHNSILLI